MIKKALDKKNSSPELMMNLKVDEKNTFSVYRKKMKRACDKIIFCHQKGSKTQRWVFDNVRDFEKVGSFFLMMKEIKKSL